MIDHFRPRNEPARAIYDALLREAEHRNARSVDEWHAAEMEAVWKVARDYAEQHGLKLPTMDDVEKAARQGYGHVDYAAKLAYALANTMRNAD